MNTYHFIDCFRIYRRTNTIQRNILHRSCKPCSTCSRLYIYDSIFFHCADDISDCNWVASCALLLFVWNSSIINLGKREFYTDFDNMSIQVAVENRLGRKVLFPAKFLGILEPEK